MAVIKVVAYYYGVYWHFQEVLQYSVKVILERDFVGTLLNDLTA